VEPALNEERAAALRALDAADEPIAAIETDAADGAHLRRALIDIGDAVENALRRWLRDAPTVPFDVRLKALAGDELRPDEVLGELRRHDIISLELAAGVHELLEVRRRLVAGSAPEPDDSRLATGAVERLRIELESPATAAFAGSPTTTQPFAADDTLAVPPDPPRSRFTRSARPSWAIPVAALVIAVLVGLLIFLIAPDRDDPNLAQGISLFRSGAYAEAASHFWRSAEANPDDPTPHLYLARIHRRMDRPDLAGPALSTALDLDPGDAAAHAELGFLLIDGGRAEQAVERFRTALRLDAESSSAWIGLVRALRAAGRDGAADRVLARAPEAVRDAFARPR
jgi:tetratricopeptide (TPR) repeat protein